MSFSLLDHQTGQWAISTAAPLLAFLSSWLTPTSVASRNPVTCTTSHFMTKQMSQRPSPSRLRCMSVCEGERECRGVKHDQKQKSTPCKCDPFYVCVNELHGSESAFSFTFIPLSKPCLWQWRNPLPSLRFLPVATVSPPLKSVEEVRGRKPKLSSQFRSVSCLHPRCLPLPSAQTSSNVLRNFKKQGHGNIQREIKEDKQERKERKTLFLLDLFLPAPVAVCDSAGGRSTGSTELATPNAYKFPKTHIQTHAQTQHWHTCISDTDSSRDHDSFNNTWSILSLGPWCEVHHYEDLLSSAVKFP